MDDVGYTIEATHLPMGETIVRFELSTEEGEQIEKSVFSGGFWDAPGGASAIIDDEIVAATISRILKNRYIMLSNTKHRSFFHVYLK